MIPDLQRIEWMPSPPLVPDDGPISLDLLRRMTLGDADLEREVLGMFSNQAVRLLERLQVMPEDAAAVAHTLKGSARAIGALDVADAAEGLEAALRDGDPADALAWLGTAVAQARAAIADMLGVA
ncbi:MAG: Hpt domain-containing protein [Bradyrhizobium sp.]|jgi:HPt (histidine-containing phosphotransfer) domain-containing protein|uniref:Hpt domain-containing protein n=1 Tax=Bradyrhizobium denitrificans TaxID=2734912 RepID=A0ABS5GFG8_9BRAD|nr:MULTISPECIES: Hpt domain-containing protein [Bradyrhizobium]MBR1140072.1 Hpt domain-containing protein [Bradyrhizobium denitrificans]MCL8483329.1 Hpt domain-containing protein [Bradyrhizobium denitrificans]MDU0957445.1 Hpt domain-containing protein [Bradyrhizobium sp.]MDU1496843.1 Hpt domain-containing protein [Bradyrhizobium sp.]MDU1546967.1 Hpt domain-containing protein [Bradyrhizobium sp.]